MPVVEINLLRGRSAPEKRMIFDAVHEALVEALHIPEDDRMQRMIEHSPEDFDIPPDKSHQFTLVNITMFPGRSMSAKRRLYTAIVANLGGVGIPASDVFIVVHEPPMENWGIRGGVPASDVDIGFQVDV